LAAHRLALGAEADDAQEMLRDFEVMLGGHRVLDRFELSRKEFDNLPALRANHVIVMLMFVVVFVVRAPVAEADFARETGFSKQLERAIDGRLADGRVFFFN
jgi:hypothetical protein